VIANSKDFMTEALMNAIKEQFKEFEAKLQEIINEHEKKYHGGYRVQK